MRSRLRFHPGFGTATIMAPPVRYCIPGERLCNLEEGSPGSGTYTRHGYIFSSLAGCLMKSCENGAVKEAACHLLSLFSLRLSLSSTRKMSEQLKKTRLLEAWRHFSFIHSIKEESRANLWGLGSATSFSLPGVQMVPISWCEMQCPKTHTKEFRKVARVQPEFLQT
ncbi:exosome complex component CSL4 [Cebus imitator]|uniref:exosome complex component CSL4 n=1 Tax=Cebus imitator TaxID=2715852 RepID=UPI0018982EB4|nr:exosome complex component CSL4 [Cebus imitator]